ncbi:MAG: maleylpyruvate isomerase family mycothiol-dependent enzyme [Catenulispora sp.]|nr:maleylpyruvate isomerase family mycothiol-dependent enzyme [Catenulispora sp.]
MKVFDMIVAERRHMAALLATLTPAQLRTPSLCAAWTVHDIGAHLISYLRLGQLKIYYAIARTGADFDRFNIDLTRRYARRPAAEIAAYLDEYASSRVTIPRSGYDPVLADIVLHDLDVRRPLGIARPPHEDRLRVVFGHLAGVPSPGFAMRGRLAGLRLEATDTGWVRGTGAPDRGPAESIAP